jgi:tetratricopeptide (TPR) repeat protein
MKPRIMQVLLLFAAALFAISHITHAQDGVLWYDGCEPQPLEALQASSQADAYTEACNTYRACTDNMMVCYGRAALTLMSECTADDQQCAQTALLYTSAIQSFLSFETWWPSDGAIQPDLVNAILAGREAFERGDYEAALEAYKLDAGETGVHGLALARTIIYQALDDLPAAVEAASRGLGYMPNDPLLLYTRANLYGALGDLDRASFDTQALNETFSDEAIHTFFVDPLVARYPIDSSAVQNWLLYPVQQTGGGPGGGYTGDVSLEAPEPIQIGFYQDETLMFARYLDRYNSDCQPPFCRVFLLLEGNNDGYSYTFTPIDGNESSIYIARRGNVLMGQQFANGFEYNVSTTYMLAPSQAPDPRQQLLGERCGVLSRLKPGMHDVGSMGVDGYSPTRVYDSPGGAVIRQLSFELDMEITGESECIDETLWWPMVDDEGLTGWVAENRGNEYLLYPSSADEQRPLYCPGASESVLFVGSNGESDADELHDAPGSTATVVATLPPGETYEVINGPRCADSRVWWEVESASGHGWLAE